MLGRSEKIEACLQHALAGKDARAPGGVTRVNINGPVGDRTNPRAALGGRGVARALRQRPHGAGARVGPVGGGVAATEARSGLALRLVREVNERAEVRRDRQAAPAVAPRPRRAPPTALQTPHRPPHTEGEPAARSPPAPPSPAPP